MTTVAHKHNDDRLDRYWSPAWTVRVLLDRWRAAGVLDGGETIVDPCCGEGAILMEAARRGLHIIGGDICVPEGLRQQCDFFEIDARHPDAAEVYASADVVVTNPPYFADTGTAGEVLSSVVAWGKPVAALVNSRFTAEACQDRANLLYGERSPTRIINLGRVEFSGPEIDGDGTPVLSQWVTWEPAGDRATRTSWVTPEEREAARGQASLTDFLNDGG